MNCRPVALLVAGLAACTSQDNAVIEILLGGETTTLTQSPAVTEIVLQAYDTSGNATTIGSSPISTTTIPLQSLNESNTVSFGAIGFDSQDASVVFGATIPFLLSDVVGDKVPVFVARINQFARAPNPFSGDLRQAPLLATMQGQYLFVAGGAFPDGGTVPEVEGGLSFTPTSTTEIYDFGEFTALPSPPTLPSLDGGAAFAPQSLAMTGTVAWLISPQGGVYYDLSQNGWEQISEPASGTFVSISGGITVSDNIGTQYVVGGTRTTGGPTATVLEINPNDTSASAYPDGNVGVLSLSTPRLGAAATWVQGRGLVVLAGSAAGAGVEVLDPATGSSTGSSMSGSPLPYKPDPSVGAGAASFSDDQHVLLAGGILPNGKDAGLRVIDLACTSAPCTPTWWTSLPIAIANVSAFTLSSTTALVVGSEPGTGVTHAFYVTGPASSDAGATDAGTPPDAAATGAAPSDAAVTPEAAGEAAVITDATGDAVALDAMPSNATSTAEAGADDDAESDGESAGPGTTVELTLPSNQDSDGGPGVLRNARAIMSPVGTIVVFGGYDVIDSFQPPP
jgi:hypothetical protein